VHRSPGFLTSNLIGRREDGEWIKEFEASHGTAADMWEDHLKGKETSFNPLGMATALLDTIQWAGEISGQKHEIDHFTTTLRKAMHHTFRYDKGTRDMSGPSGFTTEQFVDRVAWRFERYLDGRVSNHIFF
jgi:isocitrate dehydrogenase